MQAFVLARLSLRCGFDLGKLPAEDADPAKAQRLAEAIQIVCPHVQVERERPRPDAGSSRA